MMDNSSLSSSPDVSPSVSSLFSDPSLSDPSSSFRSLEINTSFMRHWPFSSCSKTKTTLKGLFSSSSSSS
ncbi:hypothetical protein MTO96_045654 [Rhipicephalus appendiculatus]